VPRRKAPKGMTVAEWADVFQDYYPADRNERSRGHVDFQIAQFVRKHGHMALEDVDILTAQKWASRKPGQVRYLRLFFGTAVKAGLVPFNVWKAVEIKLRSKPRMPPTLEQLGGMVAAARERGRWWDHFADCMLFTAYSGARGGEVEGVQAKDVLEAGSRVVLRGKRHAGEKQPRVRTVVVFEPGRSALRRQKPRVGRVWHAPSGGPLAQRIRAERFNTIKAEVGYSGTFHGLRHYCTSWLLDQGASKMDVAVQLGHMDEHGRVDTKQIERVYGHVAVEPALKRLEAAVDKGVPDGDADAGRGAGADDRAADGGA